ncbi:LPXTG cell wall anchor domain-containing protein [Micromonospora sp. CPCC 205371]|nr:LPXTG cell wall anchor domain-containing protein [Micromonospora sp. CPCC 205371]
MSTLKTRLAAGAAALIVAASVGASISSPALAAGPQLELSYDAFGEVDNSGRLVGAYAYNQGDEPASDVTMTFDASGVRDVDISVPDWIDYCQLDGQIVTCHLPGLAAEHTEWLHAFELKSKQQSKPGPAGTVKGTIRGFGPDGAEYTGGGDLEVTIIESGPDLVASTADINSAKDPVGGGDLRPVTAAIYNDGDTPTGDWYVQISVPTGAGIVEQYSDCEYRDWWPGEHPAGYVYGPNVVTCPAPPDLEPLGVGEGIAFVDETGESLFHVAFGKNLRGPGETGGSVQVGLVDDLESERAPRRLTRKGSSGKTFADAVADLKPTPRAANRREGNTSNNWAGFAIWTKPNTHDFAVTAEPVSGSIGDIVEIPYAVINNGPSDGAAGWRFKAPTGTVLVSDDEYDGPWCYFLDESGHPVKELPEVSCSTEGEFPAKASGYQGVKGKMKLRIISTPGDDGTLRVRSYPENAESNPANDEVKLVVTVGGSGGGLPVTGANAALVGGIGGGVVAIGAALFFFARRRRIVVVSE